MLLLCLLAAAAATFPKTNTTTCLTDCYFINTKFTSPIAKIFKSEISTPELNQSGFKCAQQRWPLFTREL